MALAVLLAVSSCGHSDGVGSGATPQAHAGPLPTDPPPATPRPAARQMEKWKTFPVKADDRPIVLAGAQAHGRGEYLRDVSLTFEEPRSLPRGPRAAAGYSIISASEALDVLRGIARKHPRNRQHAVLTRVRLGTAKFWTDRGLQDLPAWQVTYKTADLNREPASLYVMAIRPSEWFRGVADRTSVAAISEDPKLLLIPLHGSTCMDSVFVETFETRTAVAFRIGVIASLGPISCAGRAQTHIIRVPLTYPVGNRVLIDAQAATEHQPPLYPLVPCGQEDPAPVDIPACESGQAGIERGPVAATPVTP